MHTSTIMVLIGGDGELAQGAAKYLEKNSIKTKNVARNPLDIQQEVLQSQPDVIIISTRTKFTRDLCISLRKFDNPPHIIAMVNNEDYYNPAHIEDVVDAIITNGDDYEQIYKQILKFSATQHSRPKLETHNDIHIRTAVTAEAVSLHGEITQILSRLCVTPNYNGYAYIREAIKIAVCDNNIVKGISKQIYPEISRRLGVTQSGVERSMRTAIHRSWEKVKMSDRLDIFGTYAMQTDWIPTNSEYIFIIADKLSCKMKSAL